MVCRFAVVFDCVKQKFGWNCYIRGISLAWGVLLCVLCFSGLVLISSCSGLDFGSLAFRVSG